MGIIDKFFKGILGRHQADEITGHKLYYTPRVNQTQ